MTRFGELARSILREAHASLPAAEQGPFYVERAGSQFHLYPFGRRGGVVMRHWYVVRPSFVQIDEDPEWRFVVMGYWE